MSWKRCCGGCVVLVSVVFSHLIVVLCVMHKCGFVLVVSMRKLRG